MNKSIVIIGIVLFMNLISAFNQQSNLPGMKPNVLFIFTDDLSASLHCYGVEKAITPNIDELARHGRMFERAYCQVALCNPSRASVMTGRRPHELGIWTNHPHFRGIYPRIKTLPEHFKDQGYHAVGIGKIYHNWAQAIEGDTQSWSEPQTMHWAAHYQDWYIPGRPYQLHFDLNKGPAVQCEEVPDVAYLDGRIANAAVNKLRELQETPFFLAVGFWKPHLPYNPPKKYWNLYDRNNLPPLKYQGPVNDIPEIAYINSNEARSYTDVSREDPIPVSKKHELRHGYFAAISYMDAQVGKIMDELHKLDLAKNTIIVFLSDHGYHAGEHGQFGKWTNFEIGARVPMIIVAPDIQKPGEPSMSIVESVDLYPTLVELCNLPDPKEVNRLAGVSLVPVLKDPDATVKLAAISQITRPLGAQADFTILGSSIRTDKYRYNVWVRRRDGTIVAEELYDLSSDIYQVKNLIDDQQMNTTRDRLYEKLMEMTKN